MSKASARSESPESPVTDPDAGAIPSSYEVAMNELEGIARRMESGEVPLEQLLSDYQRAAVLMQFCKDRLQAVEDQIKVLDDGVLKVWKPQA